VGESKPGMAQAGQQHRFPAFPKKSRPRITLWESGDGPRSRRWWLSWTCKPICWASPLSSGHRSCSAAGLGSSAGSCGRNPKVSHHKIDLWGGKQRGAKLFDLCRPPTPSTREGPSASGKAGICSFSHQTFGFLGRWGEVRRGDSGRTAAALV